MFGSVWLKYLGMRWKSCVHQIDYIYGIRPSKTHDSFFTFMQSAQGYLEGFFFILGKELVCRYFFIGRCWDKQKKKKKILLTKYILKLRIFKSQTKLAYTYTV